MHSVLAEFPWEKTGGSSSEPETPLQMRHKTSSAPACAGPGTADRKGVPIAVWPAVPLWKRGLGDFLPLLLRHPFGNIPHRICRYSTAAGGTAQTPPGRLGRAQLRRGSLQSPFRKGGDARRVRRGDFAAAALSPPNTEYRLLNTELPRPICIFAPLLGAWRFVKSMIFPRNFQNNA